LIVDLSLDGYLENALLEERSHLLEEEPIFMSAFIPHKLDNIEHFERDDQMERMHKELNNPYQKIIGKTTGNAGMLIIRFHRSGC
jgi:hypothetical protein